MEALKRNGQTYADNLVDSVLTFDDSSAWSIPSGTGTVVQDTKVKFYGDSSLKVNNTNVGSDLTFSNSSQEITITSDGNYGFSTFLQKNEVDYVISGKIEIFKNGASLDTQSFSIGSTTTANDINEEWQKFTSTNVYDLEIGDEITFSFKLDADAVTALTSVKLYIDGFNFYNLNRLQSAPPVFSPPYVSVNKATKESFGVYNYGDVTTQTTPIALSLANTDYELTNDGAGAQSSTLYKLTGLDNLWNTATNRFNFTDVGGVLTSGDTVEMRIDVEFTTTQNDTDIFLKIELGIGGTPYDLVIRGGTGKKSSGVHQLTEWYSVYMGDANTLDNPARLLASADKTGVTVKVNGFYLKGSKRLV